MKAKLFNSIRMKLLVALILSLLATIATDVVIFGGIYAVRYAMMEEKMEDKLQNPIRNDKQLKNNSETGTDQEAQITNEKNFGQKNQYDPNEYIEDRDKTYKFTVKIRHFGFMTPYIWLDGLIILALSGVFFLAYYVAFTNQIIVYFREIQEAIYHIEHGDFETVLSVRGDSELSALAESINEMKYALKESYESERQAEKVKNDLITNVAHDLRTPLTSVIGYLELLHQNEYHDDATRQKYTDTAYQKARTLQVLINELFDYTRFQKGKVKLDLMPLDITMFLEQLLDEFKIRMEEEHLECIADIPKEPIMIEGDGEKLARAFSNLLTNAVKYGSDGKQIKVSLIELEEQVYISFTNYGKVIPQENLPYVFDKFYRVEQSRNAKTGGTGLGLAIAKNIVLMHNGEISAKSDEKGTVFTICLPKQGAEGVHVERNKKSQNSKSAQVRSLFAKKAMKGSKQDE